MADPVRISAQMMDTRETMQRFWGNRYDAQVEPYREAIVSNAETRNEPKIESALRLCKRAAQWAENGGNEMVLALAISATVEECLEGSGK